jgi:hypothetical protein
MLKLEPAIEEEGTDPNASCVAEAGFTVTVEELVIEPLVSVRL